MDWLAKAEALNAVLTLFLGGGFPLLGSVIIKQFRTQKNKQDQIDLRLKSLEYSNVAILHNKIYRQCGDHLADGFISIDDLDDLGYLFKAYKALGGNGTGETLYNKVKDLPTRK
jgi:hypothetical protein